MRRNFNNYSNATTTHDKKYPRFTYFGNFVVNRSSQQFTDEQINTLNMGLNYAVTTTPNIREHYHHQKKRNPEVRVAKKLKEKPVYYVKADKGNKVFIMDKEDYDNQRLDKINNGPYRQQRNDPLPEIVKRANRTIKECQPALGDCIGKLRTSSSTLQRIKGQPKIHKPETEMREIITANGSPTEKIAKWLVTEFQRMPIKFPSRSVSSTREFVEHLKHREN
ncbi:uncharacterized protein LOC128736855 [Sabethes cyaneus]|uniref:uncharacterized protein LOC128736855 n=1 Tax=Sabethes cyaneus TaxID=53552 RepID=UPI00237D81C2|nr:uncharacterized protein LOC128736855 [Sabethes cyaneus]